MVSTMWVQTWKITYLMSDSEFTLSSWHYSRGNLVQHPTAIAETTIAETTTIEDKSEKTTVLEEIELDLFTAFENTTALEDKKSLTIFSAIAVVACINISELNTVLLNFQLKLMIVR